MDKKKKQIVLIVLLVPVLSFVVYSNLINPKKKPRPAPPVPEAAEAPGGMSAAPPAPPKGGKAAVGELPPRDEKLLEMQAQTASEPWGRDPFNPAPTPMEGPGETNDWKNFRLSGLIPGPAGGVAVINGTEVAAGDTFRGYRLIELNFEDYTIVLEKDGQECRLAMPQE